MKFIAKTLYGLENTLAGELLSIGAADISVLNRAVSFTGDLQVLYRANYCLRTAMSVLRIISEFRIRSKDDLYRNCKKTGWDRFLSPEKTFSVVPVVNSPLFKHTGYAGLVLKDAVADWFRDKTGNRPSVNTENPDILLNLHISNDLVTVSADSSVVPLYKRGWRSEQGFAPLNEVLAAGIVLMSGWDGSSVLIDPMCGSGTIPIESALIACHIPPGKFRSFYGFQKWNDYDSSLFEEIKKDCDGHITKQALKIYAGDVSEIAVEQASANIVSAGLAGIITVERRNFRDLEAPDDNGVIILNPPYGERMKISEADNLYDMIGSVLKHNFEGYKAWIISSDRESLKKVGLRPSSRTTLFNGALECLLVRFDLYPGSRKKKSPKILTYEP